MNNDRPWMEAIEMQFAALRLADGAAKLKYHDDEHEPVPTFTRLALRQASTFAWSPDPLLAISSAARTIPDTATISAVTVPCISGFWWFGAARPGMSALMWTLARNKDMEPLAWITLFAQERIGAAGLGVPVPFEWLAWPLDQSLARAVHVTMTALGDAARHVGVEPTSEETVRTALQLFLAGCAWLQQKILVTSEGHIERHRRKQLAREHNIPPPSDVKIIELRRRESTRSGPAPTDGTPVEWSCQWIVSGHWTHQAHGPKHGERRLQYILPYVKGPGDKPLRVPSHTVYQVDR